MHGLARSEHAGQEREAGVKFVYYFRLPTFRPHLQQLRYKTAECNSWTLRGIKISADLITVTNDDDNVQYTNQYTSSGRLP